MMSSRHNRCSKLLLKHKKRLEQIKEEENNPKMYEQTNLFKKPETSNIDNRIDPSVYDFKARAANKPRCPDSLNQFLNNNLTQSSGNLKTMGNSCI